jgi:hypothetical protein
MYKTTSLKSVYTLYIINSYRQASPKGRMPPSYLGNPKLAKRVGFVNPG